MSAIVRTRPKLSRAVAGLYFVSPGVKSNPERDAYQLKRPSMNSPPVCLPTGVMPFTPLPKAQSSARELCSEPLVATIRGLGSFEIRSVEPEIGSVCCAGAPDVNCDVSAAARNERAWWLTACRL